MNSTPSEFAVLSDPQTSRDLPDGIALAVPGPFDHERGISVLQQKYASLYKVDVRGERGNKFGIPGEKITLLNDAQAFGFQVSNRPPRPSF